MATPIFLKEEKSSQGRLEFAEVVQVSVSERLGDEAEWLKRAREFIGHKNDSTFQGDRKILKTRAVLKKSRRCPWQRGWAG